MLDSRSLSPRSGRLQRLLGVLLLMLSLSVAGCGLVGGGDDDGEDEGYPEPPGRPNAAVVTTAPPAV